MEELYQYDQEHRDTIATVDAEGKRVWIYPKKPEGKYHLYRVVLTIVLLGIFFLGPFLKIEGQPFLLLNIFERKFVILGQAFWPQDFFILALALVTFFVFVILFTAVFGRVWCGWACPQTLFMEMVFRKIEYWIEGNANQQRKLDMAPWNMEKIVKKSAKQLIFILIALLISHTVMAYLIGATNTLEIVSMPPTDNPKGFIGLMCFTGIFYWVFAWFREQACVAVCPYGRLQGVLLGKNSLAVAYDWIRGEKRGKLKKDVSDETKGDCIDCKLCVHVCPTGIDIRNGTQLECVNCTACIDACDEVMVKINKPTGLIRFASYNSIKNGINKLFDTRIAGYSLILTALLSLLAFLMVGRSDIEITILKVPGTLYQQTEDGQISNLYNIQFINKTFEDKEIEIKLKQNQNATLEQVGGEGVFIKANDIYKGVFFIKMPKVNIQSAKTTLEIQVLENGLLLETASTNFIGPVNN